MIKTIIGLFVGMILMGVLVSGPLSSTPVKGKFADSSQPEALANIAETYHQALLSALHKAGDEIQDEDIARFFQKLLQEYDLDEASHGAPQDEDSSRTELLPDIKNINQVALSLPLREAGKNIQDEDIARFYYKFLKSAGWTIESD